MLKEVQVQGSAPYTSSRLSEHFNPTTRLSVHQVLFSGQSSPSATSKHCEAVTANMMSGDSFSMGADEARRVVKSMQVIMTVCFIPLSVPCISPGPVAVLHKLQLQHVLHSPCCTNCCALDHCRDMNESSSGKLEGVSWTSFEP
jgi:hypothetical protein